VNNHGFIVVSLGFESANIREIEAQRSSQEGRFMGGSEHHASLSLLAVESLFMHFAEI
jgi:hypothetical protein